jgi:hypothetical protein
LLGGILSRKETVWVARHKSEEEEINRIIKNSREKLGIELNKLEASIILAERSKEMFWSDIKARDTIRRIKGV